MVHLSGFEHQFWVAIKHFFGHLLQNIGLFAVLSTCFCSEVKCFLEDLADHDLFGGALAHGEHSLCHRRGHVLMLSEAHHFAFEVVNGMTLNISETFLASNILIILALDKGVNSV